MGTRAIYVFEDDHDEVAVYKHYDNYPQGATHFINNAKKYAWKFPRFEADEFGAAFVVANKDDGGGVRLVPPYKDQDDLMKAYDYCDFFYFVKFKDGDLEIRIEGFEEESKVMTLTQMKALYGVIS